MRWKTFAIGWTLALAVLLFAQRRSPLPQSAMFSRVVDLTYSTPQYLPNPAVCDDSENRRESSFSFSRNCPPGTRLDLPAREILGQWAADDISAQRLIAPLVVIDVTQQAARSFAYAVSAEDIANWESRHGHVPAGAVVMARTRSKTDDGARVSIVVPETNLSAPAPGFSLEAVRFLVEARGVYGIGIDGSSLEPGSSRNHSLRAYIASRRVYGIENVANLNAVPEADGLVVVAPSKNSTGLTVPVRVLALTR